MNYQPIENYGVIGDLNTVALVGLNGSIDFMCFPNFDSPTIFAALLDHNKGGHFEITPTAGDFHSRQRYLPDTNMLLTRFMAAQGVAAICDFMPVRHLGHSHDLIRRMKVIRGEISFRMICAPKFNYARSDHTVEKRRDGLIFDSKGPDKLVLRLRSSVPVRIENGAARAEFKLRAGQTATFILEEARTGAESPSSGKDYVSEAFKETMNFWLSWIGKSRYHGRWREMVNRSALTLKLLTSQPHGSIVAAPTFGLPENIGGPRNWDYRYTWVRDASFTIYALMRLGYTEEAAAFMRWIEARCHELGPQRPLRVMFGLDGRRNLPEKTLSHLEGYRQSRPVRIGNAAYRQLQLDIYGELLDSVFIYSKHGAQISYDFWVDLRRLVDWVCVHWRRRDEGIWEVRGGPRAFLYSRVLCWVAVDRGIRLAQSHAYPAPLGRWQAVRDRIYRDIQAHFWDPKLRAFVQYQGAKTVDAASLLLPLVKFIGPTDPRWRSTLSLIEKVLVEDSLVYRYNVQKAAPDGLAGREGTFSMCSFWYVECLARAGDLRQARFIFEKALGFANHLGLYAEQLGPCGEHLGNFPQALSHIALISAAWNLDQRLSQVG